MTSNIGHRSEPVAVATPRSQVEVVRQQWRSQRRDSAWEWVWAARRAGQVDWRHAASACEAIRQATLVRAGKAPSWLLAAAKAAEQQLTDGPASS